MIKKIFLVLLSLLLITSCDNQLVQGFAYGLKNLISTPVRILRKITDSITGNTYENFEKKSEKLQEEKKDDEIIVVCNSGVNEKYVLGENTTTLDDLKDIKDNLVGQICTCKVWGTCSEELCSCGKLCPKSFELFKRDNIKELKDYSKKENSLAFLNDRKVFNNKINADGFFGVCTGFPPLISKFNRLALFDKNSKPSYNLDSDDEEEQKKAMRYYKNLINRISDNNVTKIPGFANLHDFSEHPAIQEILKDKVIDEWGDINMRPERLGVWFKEMDSIAEDGPVSPRRAIKTKNTFVDIKERLDNFMQPAIHMRTSLGLHEVLVSHYTEDEEGNITLCTRDSNPPLEEDKECSRPLWINKEGRIMSDKHGKIANIGISDTEDSNVVAQINSLHKHCEKEKCGNKNEVAFNHHIKNYIAMKR